MINPFISDGDSYVYDSDHSRNDDNMSICDGTHHFSDEGQYSIIRNEVRSTWPKRRPKYQKPHENMLNDETFIPRENLNSQNDSPINGSISDIIFRDVDMNLNNLKDSLATLTQKLEDVSVEKLDKTNMDRRLLEENHNLQSKIKHLELQLHQTDLNEREDLEKLRQNNEMELKRILTNKNKEIQERRMKVAELENETSSQRITCLARKNEMDKLYYEEIRLKEKIMNNDQQFNMLTEEVTRLKEITDKEIDVYMKERDLVKKTAMEMQEKLSTKSSSSNILIPMAENQIIDLQKLVQKLSQENRSLRENLEELQGELLTLSLEEGRSLLRVDDSSWASESNNYTKPELINFIIKEKDINTKLLKYSDNLISKIIDVNPSILEI